MMSGRSEFARTIFLHYEQTERKQWEGILLLKRWAYYSAVRLCPYPFLPNNKKWIPAHIYSIPEIMVSDPYQTREVRSASPLQVFNKEELKNLQALQVSDAGKTFQQELPWRTMEVSGGLKIVSIQRSRGTAHRCFLWRHHRQRLPDRTSRHRTFLLKQRRPPFAQQRTKRQHLPACPFFCFCRYTEHTDTDSAFQRRQAD